MTLQTTIKIKIIKIKDNQLQQTDRHSRHNTQRRKHLKMTATMTEVCNQCFEEQEDLLERTGGSCGQIVCTHMGIVTKEEEKKEEEKERGEKRKSTKNNKSSNEKKQKTEDEYDTSFPTMMEMTQAQVMAFSKLPENVIYKIEKAVKKVETFNGNENECAYLTLRKKGSRTTQLVRSTRTVYKNLYENERYEENQKKNEFFIINLGEKVSSNQLKYCNFTILRK